MTEQEKLIIAYLKILDLQVIDAGDRFVPQLSNQEATASYACLRVVDADKGTFNLNTHNVVQHSGSTFGHTNRDITLSDINKPAIIAWLSREVTKLAAKIHAQQQEQQVRKEVGLIKDRLVLDMLKEIA